ncbi:hypothetical protein pipiens_016350, partial [Culex pipiens pipiens]
MSKILRYYYSNVPAEPGSHIFLEKTKIPYERCLVNLGKGEHLTDEFKAVNRFQKVPCIVDKGGDLKLAESVAILRYLAREYPAVADHWYPKDSRLRARVDEYMSWQQHNTRATCAIYFQYVAAATHDGNQEMAGFDPCAGRPNLTAWMARVREETNPYYDQAHKLVYKIAPASNCQKSLSFFRECSLQVNTLLSPSDEISKIFLTHQVTRLLFFVPRLQSQKGKQMGNSVSASPVAALPASVEVPPPQTGTDAKKEKPKCKACCACPETKRERDA